MSLTFMKDPEKKDDIYQGMSLAEQEILAERIKLLWGFIYSLKKHRDLLKRLADDANKRASFAVSAAVLNPWGYEVAEKKHKRVARRAELLVEMLDTLEETDKEVVEAEKDKIGREKIAEMFI